MKRTFDIAPWHVATHKWDPQDKRLQESMTSLANENLGMRGFFEEGYSGDHMEGIYLGGVWFPDKTRVGWWKNHPICWLLWNRPRHSCIKSGYIINVS